MSDIDAENNAKEQPKADFNSEVTGACTSTGVHSLVGEIVDGKYRVISQLGSGGMGAVYKAEHSMMDRVVAVKVLHPHLVENEDLLRRFQHEARIACKLTHPNAVSIYDFGVWRAAPYIVMEYVEGETLKEYRLKKPEVDLREIQTIFVQVCSALAQAHDLGIVHRDLKPDNIMLTREKNGNIRSRVLDFGIAKVLSEKAMANQAVMTQTGTFFGTPKYASPEQVLEKTLDGRSDIYTIGIILYELLSGQVPFDAPSLVEILMKLLNEEPIPLRKFKPQLNIPAEVDELVMKCLEKKPSDRFQSMHELQGAISQLSLKRSKTSKLPIALALGAVAVILAAYGVTQWRGPKQEANVAQEVTPLTLIEHPTKTTPEIETISPEEQARLSALVDSMESSSESSSTEGAHGNPLFGFVIKQVAKAAFGVREASSASSLPDAGPEVIEEPPDPYAYNANSQKEFDQSSVSSESSEILATNGTDVSSDFDVESSSAFSELSSQSSSQSSEISFQSSSQFAASSNATEDLRKDIAKIEDGKKEATILYNAGRKLLQNKRYAEAAAKFEQAIQRRPDAVGSYISLGNCYLRLGQNERAFSAFQSAVKNDPSYGPSHYNLAAYYALTGQDARAIASLSTALKLDSAIRSIVRSDPDFSRLRNSPEYIRLIGR